MRFEVPEDLSALTDSELADLEAQGIAAFDDLPAPDSDDLSDDDVGEMEAIGASIAAVRAEQATRSVSAEERVTRAAAAAAAVRPPEATEAPAPVPEEGDTEESGEDDAEDEAEEEAPSATKIAASAAAPKPKSKAVSVVRSSVRREVPAPQRESALTVSVAPDVSGFAAGQRVEDIKDIAKAFSARSKGFPTSENPPRDIRQQFGVVSIQRGFSQGEFVERNWSDQQAMLDAAGDEKRLAGNSLTAAGGWCAPSETLYDLCGGETLDGLIDLPTITVNRGGIRFTQGPDFSAIYAAVGFCQTEAQAIAGTVKPCFEVPCPAFTEVRLDACGVCIKAPILTNAGYPELVERWIQGALVAHEHKMSARVITSMQTLIGAAVTAPTTGSMAHSTLTALELTALGIRYRYRLSENETLEVVAPIWLKAAIRADLANRTGGDVNVSDAQIDSYFSARNLRVQWVYGYGDTRIVTPNCLTDFPDTAEVMIYRAGTFIKGTADIISLDTLYDTTDLSTNMYTAVFTEEGVLTAMRCPGACRVVLPVCVSGRTGAHDVTACYGITDV